MRAGQRVEVRVEADTLTIHATGGGPLLATHARATRRGSWVIDPTHWDGLPDGHTRATVIDFPTRPTGTGPADAGDDGVRLPGAEVVVAVRPLTDYAAAAGVGR